MTAAERRRIGAHYTTEENILKTIRPLFVDDLEQDITTARSLRELEAIHDRLAALRFLDPACGCGNFLLIAYRELRRLELTLLQRIQDVRGKPSRTPSSHVRRMLIPETRQTDSSNSEPGPARQTG
jgi:type II restriction/modification system DNA methylase subunit YeeA